MRLHHVIRTACVLVPLAVSLLASSNASAFEIFLDHDLDNNPTTIDSIVVCDVNVEIPMNIVLVFDESELASPPSSIEIGMRWNCHMECLWDRCTRLHGRARLEVASVDSVFTNYDETFVTHGCIGAASVVIRADVRPDLLVGRHVLATYSVMRYPDYFFVRFKACSEEPADARASFLLATDEWVSTERCTWGRLKALYSTGAGD